MSSTAEYLSSLEAKGVRLWLEKGELRYHARRGTLGGEELTRLRLMKAGVIEELRQRGDARTEPASPPAITHPSLSHDRQAPLSAQQQWLLSLANRPEGWQRKLVCAFRLSGPLNPHILESALTRVACRHGALRTRIVDSNGMPQQNMDPPLRVCLETVWLEGEATSEVEHSAISCIRELAGQQLDDTIDPVMSAWLLQAAQSQYFLVLVIHRLAADCPSVSLLLCDLWDLYDEESHKAPLPSSSGQHVRDVESTHPAAPTEGERRQRYLDYALRQQMEEDSWQRRHGEYWAERLKDAGVIRWPADEQVEGGQATKLASFEFSFGSELSTTLRKLGKQAHSLSALVLLSVYVGFVSRWCGQRDFVIPFLIAGRHAEQQDMVGYFSQVLYLRMILSGTESFMELLKRVSNEFYRAMFRQDFGRMAREQPQFLRGTLCQWLSWHPADVAGLEPQDHARRLGLTLQPIRFQSPEDLANVPPGVVDIEISFFENREEISALTLYRADLFSRGTMSRFAESLTATAGQLLSVDTSSTAH